MIDTMHPLHAVIALDSFILGDGEITKVDATYIQRYATHVKVPYPIREIIT